MSNNQECTFNEVRLAEPDVGMFVSLKARVDLQIKDHIGNTVAVVRAGERVHLSAVRCQLIGDAIGELRGFEWRVNRQ